MKSFIVHLATTDSSSSGLGLAFLVLFAVLVWVVAIVQSKSIRRHATERRLIRLATVGAIVGALVWWHKTRKDDNTYTLKRR